MNTEDQNLIENQKDMSAIYTKEQELKDAREQFYTKEQALKDAIEQFRAWKDGVKTFCETSDSDYSPYEFYLYEQNNETIFTCFNSSFHIGKKIVGFVQYFFVEDTYVFGFALDCPEDANRKVLEQYMADNFKNLKTKIMVYPHKP